MEIKTISYIDLKEKVKKGDKYQLVDIREPYELEVEGVSNAIHIPMGELVKDLMKSPMIPILFFIAVRKRSTSMMHFLQMNKLCKDNYYSLEGGFQSILEFSSNENNLILFFKGFAMDLPM